MRLRLLLLVFPLVLASCSQGHYVVLREDTPLYPNGWARGETPQPLAYLPRGTHGPLDEEPEEHWVFVDHEGQRGYVRREDVRLFSYLDPDVDGGEDRRKTIRSNLVDLQLEDEGADWPEQVVDLVRGGQVVEGMTRPQVELAWGWPQDVEPNPLGGERWIYREEHTVPVAGVGDGSWGGGWSNGWSWRRRSRTWGWGVGWGISGGCGPGPYYQDTFRVRVPVVVERCVEFDPDGLVQSVEVRRYLSG
jgi:hypothetical protein